jgi:hypothetical protein
MGVIVSSKKSIQLTDEDAQAEIYRVAAFVEKGQAGVPIIGIHVRTRRAVSKDHTIIV